MSKCVSNTEGVILLNQEQKTIDVKWINYTVPTTSRYLSLLYDSVLAVALAEQLNFTNATFPGISGQVQIREGKRLSNISIIHIQNYSNYEIGYYDTASKELYTLEDNNPFKAANTPMGNRQIIYDRISDAHIALVLLVFAFFLTLVTVNLILYVYFHKEPEIKATSVTLSMCMFLGCYILLLYIPLYLVTSLTPTSFLCMWRVWFTGLGLPFPLILGTLLFKMLRVYVIFFHPHSYKKKLCSDGALFMFVLLLTSPTILVLTAWTAVDYYSIHTIVIQQKGYLEVHEVCLSNHTVIWLGLLLLNFFILLIAVIVVAFKTSKIRYKNFRDAKATNIYAFLVSFLTVMTLFYWYFFRKPGVEHSLIKDLLNSLFMWDTF